MTGMDKVKTVKDKDVYISLGIFFLAAFGYFFFVANYVLYFQETQALFVFSRDYLDKYLYKPGGLLEYAGRFITQFYASKLAGSLILSVILTLPGVLLLLIQKRKFQSFSLSLLLILIPSCILMLMQANYYHLAEYNIGFILILAYYLFSVLSDNKYYRILVIILWPLFYYLAGAYALIFAVMHIIQNLFSERGNRKYLDASLMMLAAAISFMIFWKLFFLQPLEHILFFPLPLLENAVYKSSFFLLVCYLIIYPFIRSSDIEKKYKWLNKRIFSFMPIVGFSIIGVFVLARIYKPQTARVIELERLIFNEKFDEAIRFQEEKPARNLIGEYFYNIALSETGQLCERLFIGNQDFGSGSLVLPWGDEHLNRGAYFYYSVGLTNEAHRWAYEEMVVYGYRPQNIKLLAKTSLINGDFRMAGKYINILKKTIYYRDLAKRYEKMADNPDLISSDPELFGKSKILPKDSFFIQFNEPQNNLPLLLSSQPDNMKAFEYYMAGLLLTKNVEVAMNNVGKMKGAGYTRIPRFIEEAVLIYYNSTKVYPDLGGLEVSSDTRERFAEYFAAYVAARKNASTLKQKMEEGFGDTFWYYFHFK
jgi:hypothetical protein